MPKGKDVVVPETGELLSMDETIETLNKLFHVDDVEAANIDSVTDLEAMFADQGGVIEFKGSVFDVVDKETLIGKPFNIVDIRFYHGSYGDACAVLALTENGDKVVFNDGSTGIYAQCKRMVSHVGRRGGFACPKGLRVSRYEWQEKDFDGNPIGTPKPAATYYIA